MYRPGAAETCKDSIEAIIETDFCINSLGNFYLTQHSNGGFIMS